MGFDFSGAPEPASVIPIDCYLSISDARDIIIAKEFGIFTESAIFHNLQSIAKENCYQLLELSETDPAQYIFNHPEIERLSKRYQVDVLYPRTALAYSRLTWIILPSISSLRNDVPTHLRSTLQSRLMVTDLTPHPYSIRGSISRRRHFVLTDDHTPNTLRNCVYPLCIPFEQFVLHDSNYIFFLLEWFQSVTASTQSIIFQTLNYQV